MQVLSWLYLFTHHYQHLSVNLDHPQGKLYVKLKVTSGQLYSLHAYTKGVNHILVLAFSKNGWHLLPVLLIIWYIVNYVHLKIVEDSQVKLIHNCTFLKWTLWLMLVYGLLLWYMHANYVKSHQQLSISHTISPRTLKVDCNMLEELQEQTTLVNTCMYTTDGI